MPLIDEPYEVEPEPMHRPPPRKLAPCPRPEWDGLKPREDRPPGWVGPVRHRSLIDPLSTPPHECNEDGRTMERWASGLEKTTIFCTGCGREIATEITTWGDDV